MIFNKTKYNEEWETLSLNDLGNFSRGKSKHRPRNDKKLFVNGKYPLIQTSDVKKANLYINSHNKCYNEFGLSQSKLWDAGTLCITIAANIAETGILKYPMCFPDSVVGFSAYKDKSSEKFMHYVFSYIKDCILKTVSGSIQDNINIEYLSELKFKVPPKTYQDSIVDFLESFDNKIECNNEIIEKIKTNLKIQYNYWFEQYNFPNDKNIPYQANGGKMIYNELVQKNVPENWKIINLGEYLNFEKGIEVGTESYIFENINEEHIKFYRVSDIDDSGNTYVLKENIQDVVVKEDDILVSFDGTPGKIGIGLNGAFSTGMKKISDSNNIMNNAFIYTIFNSDYIQYIIEQYSSGSNIKHASESLNHMYVAFDEEIYLKFSNQIKELYEEILLLTLENKKLINMRNYFLPLVINGQVKLNENKK